MAGIYQITPTSVFQPTQVPGCQIWLDAADPSVFRIQSGTTVGVWTDKSSNAYTFQGLNGPTLLPNQQNGLSVVNFLNPSNQYFDGGPSSTLSNIHTHFIVYNNSVSIVGQSLLGSSNQFNITQQGGGVTIGTPAGFNSGSPAFQTGGAYRILSVVIPSAAVYPTSNGNVFSNGSEIALVANSGGYNSSAQISQIYIGAGNQKYTGTIAEVIAYNGLLTTAQRQIVEGYLASKWGLQGNLPSDHPYKTTTFTYSFPFPSVISPSIKTVSAPRAVTNDPVFLPTQISGCALWLDAADSNTVIRSGTNITQWNDKSSSQLILSQATPSSQPTLGPLLNNLQTIQFTTSQSLTSTSNLLTIPAQSRFLVFNAYNNANNNRFWLNHSSNITVTGGEYFYGGNGTIWANRKSGNLSQERAILDNVGLSVTPFNSGQWYITDLVDSNTTTDINSFLFRIDGSNRAISIYSTSSNILSGTANVDVVINTRSAGQAANVYISEILFYNAALSLSQVQQVEGYLAWKWGLVSSLPNGHPYKTPQIAPFPYAVRQATQVKFSPLNVSGCQLWLDGSDPNGDGSILVNGTSISTWVDKSGNTRNATQSGASRPTYVSSTKGIRFTASSTQYMLLPDGTLPSGNSSYFIIIVFNPKSTPASVYGLIYGGAANAATNALIGCYYAGTNMNITWHLNDLTTTSGKYAVNSTNIYETSYITGSQRIQYTNGSTDSIDTPGTRNSGTGFNRIGSFYSTNLYPLDAEIFEILVYSTLTVSQRQSIEGYLAWKWGLVSTLPANHPYKLFPPK